MRTTPMINRAVFLRPAGNQTAARRYPIASAFHSDLLFCDAIGYIALQ